MRHLIALYALLTTPMPMPRQLILRGVAILLAYAATAPHAETLARVGVTPIKATVALGLIVIMLHVTAQTWNKIHTILKLDDGQSLPPVAIIGIAWGSMLIAPFTMPSDLWLANAIAAGYVAYGVMVWLLWKSDPSTLEKQNWIKSDRPKESENFMTWKLWQYVWGGVALLALARYATELEWALGYAAIPIFFHYLFWWTICATHPTEDGSAQ